MPTAQTGKGDNIGSDSDSDSDDDFIAIVDQDDVDEEGKDSMMSQNSVVFTSRRRGQGHSTHSSAGGINRGDSTSYTTNGNKT